MVSACNSINHNFFIASNFLSFSHRGSNLQLITQQQTKGHTVIKGMGSRTRTKSKDIGLSSYKPSFWCCYKLQMIFHFLVSPFDFAVVFCNFSFPVLRLLSDMSKTTIIRFEGRSGTRTFVPFFLV